MKRKVAVAMSGGVDSSVAAFLLKQDGCDVFGVMLRLWTESEGRVNRCCPPSAVQDAREVADILDIPFYVLDYKEKFKAGIVDYFTREYLRGETPNPCIYCNKDIRFGELLQEVVKLGATHLSTGHYVRLGDSSEDGLYLMRGVDQLKDQSYMLYRLSQKQLEQACFPVGGCRKPEIRDIARQAGLPTSSKEDSQDLCFLGGDGAQGFLQRQAPQAMRSGDIALANGSVVGRHKGLPLYTIGQRKGLGISWPRPLFVLDKDMSGNRLIVGEKSETFCNRFTVRQVHFTHQSDAVGGECEVQTRYKGKAVRAFIELAGHGRMKVKLYEEAGAVSPGQSAVFYKGDRLIGGGIIEGFHRQD